MKTAEQYLQEHSLNPFFVKEELGWRWDNEKIEIPIYGQDRKRIYNKARYLNPDKNTPKFRIPQGQHPVLYCAYKIENEKEIVLCEGESDCARLWQENIPAVTSTGGVGTFNIEIAKPLQGKNVILCLDTDKPAIDRLPMYIDVLTALNIPVKIVNLPEQYKDVSEYFTNDPNPDFNKLTFFTPDAWVIHKLSPLYTVESNEDFLKHDFPQKKWLIKGLIRASGISFLVGEGGVGKTTISYSVAKAASTGSDWLGKFPTTKTNFLIIDKENDDIDIKESLLNMQATSKNIYHFRQARDFSFINPTNPDKLTEAAQFLSAWVKENKIGAVIIDSMVDFYQGEENSSTDAAININAWKSTFPNIAIIPIQHENKPLQGINKRLARHRVRGSSHLYNSAQSILSFSCPEEEYPESILVEPSKVRGARKLTPFMVEMIIEPDPRSDDSTETIITGFEYKGEIEFKKKSEDKTIEAVLNLLESQPDRKFIGKDIEIELSDQIPEATTIRRILPKMRSQKLMAYDVSQRPYSYWFLNDEASE